jgi:hypothetical protein
MLCSEPQFYTGKPREISIFFSKDTNMPVLRATVQAYRAYEGRDDNGSLKTVSFPRDKVPSHMSLQVWVEGHIRRSRKSDFQNMVELLLLTYTEEGRHLPRVCG